MIELLLEVLTEEMPPSHIKAAVHYLEKVLPEEFVAAGLVDMSGKPGRFQIFGTCRRLIVYGRVADRQPDREEEIIGPPMNVAFDAQGKPTQAALGFAKSKGVSLQALSVIPTPKGQYVGAKTTAKGRPAREIIPSILPKVLSSINFPKMMRWGNNPFRFSRPIKNICCLLDGKRLPFTLAGINSSDSTYGHRLLSPEKIRIRSFKSYEQAMRGKKVLISVDKRRSKIRKQTEQKLAHWDAALFQDDELLEKLVYDVEWPLVIVGTFPKAYLKLPIEVLSTAMKKGQNLFSIVSGKKQLPYFVGVADAVRDAKGLIRRGNERVLKARLEDARFFWEQDLKIPLKKRASGLVHIVDQGQLGSYADKVQRIRKVTLYIAGKLEAKKQKKDLAEAADLCKVDLLTEMVREFPSLQGIMGGLYARENKYPAAVWKAVYEHYRPAGLDDALPTSLNGQILSIADKLDAIVGTVGSGIRVTGSRDPFGLRRNAQAICRIIVSKKINLSFVRLIHKSIAVYGDSLKISHEQILIDCLSFFASRLEFLFSKQGFRYDLIDAALSPGIENIYYAFLRVKALDALRDSPQFAPMILIAKRVNNILREQPSHKIKPELLLEKEERELYTTFSIIKEHVTSLIAKGEFLRAQKMIFRLRPVIDNFFDRVLVMAEDKKIQKNRLALLQEISGLFCQIADYSKIVVSEDMP